MIDISEIFLSIQGESTYNGLPCIFIRLAGCNLRCSYCDTFYSYEKTGSFLPEDILKTISKYSPFKLVEITGGEPLLQDKVHDLISLLHNDGYKILLETNGSLSLEKIPDYVTKIVDIKCPGSRQEESFLLSNLNFLTQHDELKFVLTGYEDYRFAKEFLSKHNISGLQILFSPVTPSLESKTLADWILKDRLPVRLNLQIHKYIWSPEEQKGR